MQYRQACLINYHTTSNAPIFKQKKPLIRISPKNIESEQKIYCNSHKIVI